MVGSIAICVESHDAEWTWTYKKTITTHEAITCSKRGVVVFSRSSTHPFTQLVFSWNAMRPQGHFSFMVQARDQATKKWYPWHHMSDWGKSIQKSYNSTTDRETNFHHVRLEIPRGTYADAFRIKVESKNGADLALLHRLHVCISDLSHFPSSQEVPQLPSLKLTQVPQLSQMILDHPRADSLCSPTSMSMLVGYLTRQHIDPVPFAEQSYDSGLDAYGSWPFNTAHAYEHCRGNAHVYVTRLSSFQALYAVLKRGVPVVVSVRGTLEGAAKEYNNGHLLTVIGWDNQRQEVICHDPAFASNDQTCVRYQIQNFLTAWNRSRHLAYIAELRAS